MIDILEKYIITINGEKQEIPKESILVKNKHSYDDIYEILIPIFNTTILSKSKKFCNTGTGDFSESLGCANDLFDQNGIIRIKATKLSFEEVLEKTLTNLSLLESSERFPYKAIYFPMTCDIKLIDSVSKRYIFSKNGQEIELDDEEVDQIDSYLKDNKQFIKDKKLFKQ